MDSYNDDGYHDRTVKNGHLESQTHRSNLNYDQAFKTNVSSQHKEDKYQPINQIPKASNGEQVQNGLSSNGKLEENHVISNGHKPAVNGRNPFQQAFTNGTHQASDHTSTKKIDEESDSATRSITKPLVLEAEELTADVLHDLFNDNICVLRIKSYVPQTVCQKLDSFLREKGSDPYTHEIRKNGKVDLLYFGVNRYGYPLNSIYKDDTGENLKKYLAEALPTMRSIRKAAAPFLSPIDKFRVELDEAWPKKANVATFKGQKTFCGIGRIMPTSLSELSETQPHFDAVPTACFPDIYKQFTANFYLNVPEEGGELEIWNVPPLDINNIENFTIPENWRELLPTSIKVKPEPGDLVLFNTRRPHAITKFGGPNPRTSIQTFIGYTKDSEVFLWV
ncbi:fe2OG dioxygenase domain-containing protein [Trichonephila clavata]|uniref:Fe2OG dioxygenase domain-containing protein n=1 Tax=Trichonephila clavata TaxID=2740835 RepID=A0A8X6M1A3_TRICU|nr:fe2OG dioxygenase domain-containing protein [Trichonephila clavata]